MDSSTRENILTDSLGRRTGPRRQHTIEVSNMENGRRRSRNRKCLSGQAALVTGASRGIGRAIAIALGRDGAQVIVHYAREGGSARENNRVIRNQ